MTPTNSTGVVEFVPQAAPVVSLDPESAALLLASLEGRLVTPRPDCHLWPTTDRGYGKAKVLGTTKRAHRVFWELKHGPIPDGLVIDHLCRIRSCCNTEHMELVTALENTRRGLPFRRPPIRTRSASGPRFLRATECKQGHEFTAENTYVDPSGARYCRTCRKANQQRRPPRSRRSQRARKTDVAA